MQAVRRVAVAGHQARKVSVVPDMFRMNCPGMVCSICMIAFRPVQWQGITWSGPILCSSSVVGPMADSKDGPERWKPPMTA